MNLIFQPYRHLSFFFKRIIILLFIVFSCMVPLFAQVPETPPGNVEQQIENLTENTEDGEIEDDSYLQQMQQYLKNPVNINTADEAELKELRILSALQIQHIITYRNLFGKFITVYELQAVPSLDLETIQRIRPFITINMGADFFNAVSERFKGGEHSVLIRATQVIERSKGFIIDSSSATNFYPGSPQKLLFRYKYLFKNLLQYGVVGEKDAGEQFFKGNQKAGFDFYSAHFFLRNIGIIKSLALGDFTVNLGQGLIQWQSLAFKKSPDVMNLKRQATVLRPYNSAGEINFHRGAGITLARANWQATVFASYKKIDANFVADTSQTQDDFISSLQTSGYHRTKSENEDKGSQRQLAIGGNLAWQFKKLHVGINTVQYQFKLPLLSLSFFTKQHAIALILIATWLVLSGLFVLAVPLWRLMLMSAFFTATSKEVINHFIPMHLPKALTQIMKKVFIQASASGHLIRGGWMLTPIFINFPG